MKSKEEEIQAAAELSAIFRYPIIDEIDFDDTYMTYDEYVESQEEKRGIFISGYIAYASRSAGQGSEGMRTEYGICPKCNGDGRTATSGLTTSVYETCTYCNGSKSVVTATNTPLPVSPYKPTSEVSESAARYLEQNHIAGDTMVSMNHGLDELPEEQNGAFYLHDLLANFSVLQVLQHQTSPPPQLREGEVEDGWVSVKDSPLFIKTKLGWECTEAGDKPFIAAVPYNDNKRPTERNLWWVMPCVVEDGKGLCIIGDEDNEEAGWQLEDVTHYKPLDLTPPKSVLPNPPKQ